MSAYTNAKIEKWEREYEKLTAKMHDLLGRPLDDPIWKDDDFWNGRWIAMVDRQGDLVDRIGAEKQKLLVAR